MNGPSVAKDTKEPLKHRTSPALDPTQHQGGSHFIKRSLRNDEEASLMIVQHQQNQREHQEIFNLQRAPSLPPADASAHGHALPNSCSSGAAAKKPPAHQPPHPPPLRPEACGPERGPDPDPAARSWSSSQLSTDALAGVNGGVWGGLTDRSGSASRHRELCRAHPAPLPCTAEALK